MAFLMGSSILKDRVDLPIASLTIGVLAIRFLLARVRPPVGKEFRIRIGTPFNEGRFQFILGQLNPAAV
jgi:hypothetical protein